MPYRGYDLLGVDVDEGVAFVTIDNPPLNLLDLPLMVELAQLSEQLLDDGEIKVVVVRSADPEFFVAHADVELLERLPRDEPSRPAELNGFQVTVERFRTMPKATIAQIEGCARGGGSELALSMDMRFAAQGRAILSQPEVALGIVPGGGGTQRLPPLMGRARTLEAVLGCGDMDAVQAERYGWVNRSLPPDELGPFVERLARRIASFPAPAIAAAKAAVDAAGPDPVEGLREEAFLFQRCLTTDDANRLMRRFLERGGQTREVELALGSFVDELGR